MNASVEINLLENNKQRQRRILCIDDDAINCMVLNHILIPLQFQVDLASSGISGLELIKMYAYDLILLDIYMPEMDGFETAAAIKEISTEPPGIIFLSAGIHENLHEKMKTLGISSYLSKPINKQALTEAINHLL